MGSGHGLVIVLLPELAGPWDAVIIGLVGGMLLFTLDTLLRRLIIPAIRLIPVVGRGIADGMTQTINDIERVAFDWAEARLTPLTNTIRRIDNRLRSMARANTMTHQATLVTLRVLRFDVIPRVQTALIVFTQERIAAVLAYVQGTAAALNRRIDAVAVALQAYNDARAQQLLVRLNETRAELLAQDQALLTYTQQLVAQAMVRADQEIARALQAASAEDGLVVAYAQQLATQTAQYARQLVQQEQAQREAKDGELQTQIATTATAIITLVLPQIAQLAKRVTQIEDSPCQQKCQTLGNLGSNLDGLDLAALLALLVGASEHPKEAAPIMTDLLAPGARLVSGQLAGLFK